ncbi:hypothetical protein HaLaN_07452 [Haematococcus lacustris]|uniref:Uncharacterized protein n=1 Tax=Haematococcus lacustris TaxID=44745 RepID=A0A699YRI1_HAELA|nr:hypothetical protein HaLaN_07452 [Haematococcus lacustris]
MGLVTLKPAGGRM